MSDPVMIAMIGAAQIVILAWLNNRTAKKAAVHATETKAAVAETKAVVVETKAAVAETKEAIVILKQQTDGIKDELVRVTGKEQRAIGKLEGKAEAEEEGSG